MMVIPTLIQQDAQTSEPIQSRSMLGLCITTGKTKPTVTQFYNMSLNILGVSVISMMEKTPTDSI